MEKTQLRIKLTPRQTLAYDELTSLRDSDVMYGGAKGGGKSFLFCVWVMDQVKRLCEFFDLKPSKNPLLVGFMGRKRSVDFSHTTLETFKKVIPPQIYKIREQDKEIVFYDTAKVWFGGLDNQETINKFNSAELAFIAIDQAEETERSDIGLLEASLRLKHQGKQPFYKKLYTSNPADCWLKEDYIDNKIPGRVFIPALPSDNPYLPDTYVPSLKSIFRHNEPLLRAYVFGDWHALQSENTLISSYALAELKGITLHPIDTRRVITCDPSLGGDECVIYALENGKVLEERLLISQRDTMRIAGEMVVMGQKHRTQNFCLDVIGIGQGIYDRLRELKPGAWVRGINSAESSSVEERFYNLRAEMWWSAMVDVQDKKIPYPEDEELRTQLGAIRFKVVDSNGKVKLEPKEETKKRIGRSPDRADAFVYGLWALKYAPVIKAKDAYNDDKNYGTVRTRTTSAMVA